MKALFIFFSLFLSSLLSMAQYQQANDAIYSGVPWFDDSGKVVSAHGACIIKEKNRYYLFGEKHSDTANAFVGFNCYSSANLYNWKFESIALEVQAKGKLGPNRVGERPKVMKSPSTGEFVMFMHVDTLGYNDQYIGYATAKTITGPYTFKGPLLYEGRPIQRWDMGAFQDDDGSGYVLIHGGDIYKLSADYQSASEKVNSSMASGFESPALFKKDGIYFFLGSHLTSWERNDNIYYTATSLTGPWKSRSTFTPKGSLTWNSQTTFVLPITGSKDTTFMFMGDRWSYPKQASAATYVWQPLTISGTTMSIPEFKEAWKINTSTGVHSKTELKGKVIENSDKKLVSYSGNWNHTSDSLSLSSSNKKGASFSLQFKGRKIGLYGLSRPDGGYAQVLITDSKGKTVVSSIIEVYCKYPVSALTFLSPVLPQDNYTLTVTVLGEHWKWVDKAKRVYSSKGNFVSFDKAVVSK